MFIGQRVRLRPMEKEDVPRFVRWFADPDLRYFLSVYKPMGLDQEEQWYEQNLKAGDEQAWSIDAQSDDLSQGPWVHIGACGFHRIDWRCRCGEVGIAIGPRDYWGHGHGTDALQTLVTWGFGTLNLHRVFLRVFADNARAIRCYEKAGFQLEGRLRQDNYVNGAYRDSLVMGLLREEWALPQ